MDAAPAPGDGRPDGGKNTGNASPGEYDYYRQALADVDLPCAFVDLDRLEANGRTIRERADGTQVRVASKSVRSRAVLHRILDLEASFEGLLCYSGKEARYLAQDGFDDLVVAYPVWQRSEIEAACAAIETGASVVLMVDSSEHIDRIASLATEFETTIPVCLDLDLSTEHLGIFFGVRRSGIRSPDAAVGLCGTIEDADGVRLAGLMGYEAQLAGVPDSNPANNAVVNAIIRLLKRRSRPEVRERRVETVAAIQDTGYDLSFVNGGGTGTVEFTIADPSVTEVTVGSGFYAPALFDHYERFQHQPAAGFAIEVSRQPDDAIYTCRGGGYIASGPPDESRSPVPWLPEGMAFRDEEGAGEVQTPIHYDGSLVLGDPVVCRHAKAGELAEQFEQLHLIENGEIVETVPTYRGDGKCFL